MKKLKEKKGITMIMFAVLGVAMIGFMALLIDIGRGYLVRSQVQSIADAATQAGAYAGKSVFEGVTGEGRAQISKSTAEAKAKQVVAQGMSGVPGLASYDTPYFNGVHTNTTFKQRMYDSGSMSVTIVARVKGLLTDRELTVSRTAVTALQPKITGVTSTGKDHIEVVYVSGEPVVKIYNENGIQVYSVNLTK